MLLRIGLILFVSLVATASEAGAQDSLEAMCESWNQCNRQMNEKYEALNAGDSSPALENEYRDLVDEANKLIKSMRKQAVAELNERPGDGQVIRTLMGIMVYDAQQDRDDMVLDVGQALIDAKVNPIYFEKAASIDRLKISKKRVFEELLVRHKEAMADDLPRVKLNTSAGEIVIELFENEAPNTVRNFVSLIESGHYSNKLFHRVIENFMAQGGGFETEGLGSGGPGYQIECECKNADARRNFTGTLSMAHAGPDTGGSQFFLNFKYNDFLDRKHTVFGRVISGMDVLEKIERTDLSINGMERPIEGAKPDRIVTAEVVRKRGHSYRVRKKGEPELPEEPVAKKEEPKKEAEEKPADGEQKSEDEESEPSAEEKKSDEPEMKEDPEASKAEESSEAPAKEESADEKTESGESEGEGGEAESNEPEAEGSESGGTEGGEAEEASESKSEDDKS